MWSTTSNITLSPSSPFATGNGEEGVVALHSSHVLLASCSVSDNKGPGLDISGSATLKLEACRVDRNVGGVWVWQQARTQVGDVFGATSQTCA